jgi:hypothetical protein
VQAPLPTKTKTVSRPGQRFQLFSNGRIAQSGIFFYLLRRFRLYKKINSQQSGISRSEFQIATLLITRPICRGGRLLA